VLIWQRRLPKCKYPLTSKIETCCCFFIVLYFIKRIYAVHDEIKDKHFELELCWVGKGNKKDQFFCESF
jgi:hypothetical protein